MEMVSKHIQEQTRIIRRTLVQSMNGVTSRAMTNAGISYARNYGVELPRLLSIAKQYKPSLALSNALWQIDTRETRMLSILLFPPRYLTNGVLLSRLDDIATVELLDFAVQRLFSQHSLTTVLARQLATSSSNVYKACLIYMVAYTRPHSPLILQQLTDIQLPDAYIYNSLLTLVRLVPKESIPVFIDYFERESPSSPKRDVIVEELRTRYLYE